MAGPEPPYTLVLTHDIDALSLRELPLLGRTLWGFLYRCLVVNTRRFVHGGLPARDYVDSLSCVLLLPLIRVGLAGDPWQKSIEIVLDLERKLGVRSTFFFIPFPRRPGHRADGNRAPRNRAAYYNLVGEGELLQRLESGGWEVGLHGIDSHIDERSAREELLALRTALPSRDTVGIRMHWLYHRGAPSWRALDKAGFAYDASLGWSDKVGFPDDRYRPFAPEPGRDLVVLPLVIHDVALFGGRHKLARRREVWQRVEEVLQLAEEKKAVVTVLWHNNSFVAPRYWGWLYEALVRRAQKDGACICRAIDATQAYSSPRYGSGATHGQGCPAAGDGLDREVRRGLP